LASPLFELNKLRKGGWDSSIIDDLVALIKREQIDLVHAHLYHANLYARFAAKCAGVPSVITVHNTYAKRKWHRQLLNWHLARSTAKIIAVSEAARQDILQYDHVAPDKVVTILNGIELQRSQSALTQEQAREKLGLAADRKVLVCVGRLVEQKGHTYLLQALAELKQRWPEIHLLVAGDGDWRQRLEAEAASLQLQPHVSFLGTRSDIADILRAADIYVMPSLWEGLALALLEGMAAGLPVLATSVGGAPDVLGDGAFGRLVAPGKADLLVQALDGLLSSPQLRQQLANAARQRAQDYDAGKMVAAVSQIYRDSLAVQAQA
jgi:glycosyltransferase involved in cell wall biosynthesis